MSAPKPKIDILRITTISLSLEKLLSGQIQYMQENGLKVATASFGDYDFSNHYKIKNLRRSISLYRDALALIEIYRLIRKLKPTIVHTHTPKAGLLGMIAAYLAGVKVRIHTVAGLPLMEQKGLMFKLLVWMERLTYFFANSVYPNSKGLLNYIKNNIWDTPKLSIIGNGSSNGINLKDFNAETITSKEAQSLKEELGLKGVVFLFIGRVVGDKGIVELVDAFSDVYKQNNNCSLLLVGPLEPELDPIPDKILKVIESHSAIHPVGFQKDVRPYIAVSDILTFPSYREGFPNVPMQCGAFQKALILSNINGCNEIVSNEKFGILVKVKSTEELQSAMLKLLDDSELRDNLGVAVQERIRDHFEQSVIWSLLLEKYKEALS